MCVCVWVCLRVCAVESDAEGAGEVELRRDPVQRARAGQLEDLLLAREVPLGALELHLERRRPGLGLPLATVVSRSDGFSGAELEQTVIEAMHLAFADARELSETDLIRAASQLVPLSRTASEQLEALKQWASGGPLMQKRVT